MEITQDLTDVLTSVLNDYYQEYSDTNDGVAKIILEIIKDNCPNQDNKSPNQDINALNRTDTEINDMVEKITND